MINDGPFVWIVSGALPVKPTLEIDVLQPKFALFREASQSQVAWLTALPGQRITSVSHRGVPDFLLSFELQAEWEMLSYTVDLIKERTGLVISQTGPTGRAAIECGRAAYHAASALYPDPAAAGDVSLELVFETAGEAKECKSAIEKAKTAARNQTRVPPIEEDDFRRTSLEDNSFQRPSNTFMDALRRFGKIVVKLR